MLAKKLRDMCKAKMGVSGSGGGIGKSREGYCCQ